MELQPLLATAAIETATVVRAIRPDQLGAPTPCREYDVRALANGAAAGRTCSGEAARRRR